MTEPSPSMPTITQSAQTAEPPKPTAGVGQRRRSRSPILSTPVGSELHGTVVTEADHHLEKQILDCAHQAARCEKLGRATSALEWTRAMQAAIAARRPEIVAALRAAEREFEDSLDYFSSDAAHQGGCGG